MSQMGAREALEIAVEAMDGATPRRHEAAQVLRMMLEQGGCGEIPPGTDSLTDAIDMAVFG